MKWTLTMTMKWTMLLATVYVRLLLAVVFIRVFASSVVWRVVRLFQLLACCRTCDTVRHFLTLDTMIEFSETLDKRYTGRQAVAESVKHRLSWEYLSIPYTSYGIDYGLFTYANLSFRRTVKRMFADLDASVTYSGDRVTVCGITVNIPDRTLSS